MSSPAETNKLSVETMVNEVMPFEWPLKICITLSDFASNKRTLLSSPPAAIWESVTQIAVRNESPGLEEVASGRSRGQL